jgi:putative ABC transport system ATP-binding protein
VAVTESVPLLACRGLEKGFSGPSGIVPVLKGVDFSAAAGESVAVIGRSGSGKSTFLGILGLLDRPTAGSYTFEGADVSILGDEERSSLRARRMAFVFQDFNLLDRLDVLENVALGLEMRGGLEEEEVAVRARLAAGQVGLVHRLRHRPAQLSGGERQRAAIARALAAHPSVLFADEPTGNLDSRTADEVMESLLAAGGELGTVILVTHDERVAARFDRVVEMRDGQLADPL